ncbi:4-hydroxyphenylacetate degradation bifunctional isomerase/decarboxylase [gamma proteobacterium HdN1]|nr:4-hydroxyphenylacetate degradation bifunctional isomerase/decarboxylase [gamma proteobacterium HdN1]
MSECGSGHYRHVLNDAPCELPVGKVVCVGRNYAAHAKELNNPVPESPIIFIKPATSIQPLSEPIRWPGGLGSCHHELEISILIGARVTKQSASEVVGHIAGIGLGLDLTLRDLQNQLKAKGQPWELAKAFDGACPLSGFVLPAEFRDLSNIQLALRINGELRQQGNSSDMLTPITELIAYISQYITLEAGDVVLTGTPAGVGPFQSGDQLTLILDERFQFGAKVA